MQDIQDAAIKDRTLRLVPESDDPAPLHMRLLPPETEPEPASPFFDIHAAWNRRRAGNALPDWHDFDFADFRGWHSRLKVSVFPDDRPDPLFRIMGETWRIVAMGNLAGVRFSEVRPKLYDRQFRDHFRAIRDQGLIGRTRGAIAGADREFLTIEVLELPYSRDGARVGGLLHCLHVHA